MKMSSLLQSSRQRPMCCSLLDIFGVGNLLWSLLLVIIVCGNSHKSVSGTAAVAHQKDEQNGGLVHGGKPEIHSHGNVTVLAGQRGELKCKVTNLANYTVTGADAYTADGRFRAFQGASSTWGLRISNAKLTDGGIYECQISTTPPISAFTYLTVVEPVTHIEGLTGRGAELFIKAGSTINLTCIVEDATENAPKHVLWRHNNRIVNFEWARGGMSLVTEKKTKGVTVSRLLIQKAVRTDSGTYICAPQNAHPAHVKIHILTDGESEKQAAMQSASTPLCSSDYQSRTVVSLLAFVFTSLLFFQPDTKQYSLSLSARKSSTAAHRPCTPYNKLKQSISSNSERHVTSTKNNAVISTFTNFTSSTNSKMFSKRSSLTDLPIVSYKVRENEL